MTITKEHADKLYNEITDVCINVIKDAHDFIRTHDLKGDIFFIDKYPRLFTDLFYDGKYFDEEFRDKIPFLKYKIPKYEMNEYPKDKNYYSLIFEGYRKEHINLKDYVMIERINNWINSESEVLKLFTDKDKIPDYTIRDIISDIVERYLYMTKATEKVPDDIEKIIQPFIQQRLSYYLYETMYFDICVPICLTTFDKEIKLNKNVEIIRIPEELQIARQVICKYEVSEEDWVAACATHMIVLHNYEYRKSGYCSFYSIIQDYSFYPLEKINEIVGIIRLATGYEIGYENILCVPKGWVYKTIADLSVVYGAKSHFVNHKYIKMDWMHLPVSYVTKKQCDDIVMLYTQYQENENRLKFSIMRFNRCMMREEFDDLTTDACIGLESLLAGGTHNEITNAIASRIPFILSKVGDLKYHPENGRSYMKKIYDLRSRIVHGDDIKDKYIYYTNEHERVYIPAMAVDFLRIVLMFMIQNPKYLEVKEIDKNIDLLVSNYLGQ